MTASTAPAAPIDRRTAWKIVLSVVVVVGAVSALLYASMKEEIQLWKSVDEVLASPAALQGKRLNVGGHVLSLTADRKNLDYQFEIESLICDEVHRQPEERCAPMGVNRTAMKCRSPAASVSW